MDSSPLLAKRAEAYPVLVRAFGKAQFYAVVANYDTDHTSDWLEMVKVQATFQRGEAGYDREARVYSETMRETLHMAIIHVFSSDEMLSDVINNRGGLHSWFIRAHATAFRFNGVKQMSYGEDLAVARNTRSTMAASSGSLSLGIVQSFWGSYDPYMQWAVERVRAMRQWQGQIEPGLGSYYMPWG